MLSTAITVFCLEHSKTALCGGDNICCLVQQYFGGPDAPPTVELFVAGRVPVHERGHRKADVFINSSETYDGESYNASANQV